MLQAQYSSDCFQRRNRYMVDRSGLVIAIWDGTPSGTGSTVQYAKASGRLVYTITP